MVISFSFYPEYIGFYVILQLFWFVCLTIPCYYDFRYGKNGRAMFHKRKDTLKNSTKKYKVTDEVLVI